MEIKLEISAQENTSNYKSKGATAEIFEDCKLFTHFFYWGLFIASGDCTSIHPEEVGENYESIAKAAEDNEADGQLATAAQQSNEDKELNTLVKELQYLRLEGNHKDADMLDDKIWKLRAAKLERVKNKVNVVADEALTKSKVAMRKASVMVKKGTELMSRSSSKYSKTDVGQANANNAGDEEDQNDLPPVAEDGDNNLNMMNQNKEMADEQTQQNQPKKPTNFMNMYNKKPSTNTSSACTIM